MPLDQIHADPNQPRKAFDTAALTELAASIKAEGLLHPIAVKPNGKGFYIVDGERRGAGWVDGGRDLMRITPAGLDALGPYDPLPTGSALIEYWRGRLGDSGKRRIFDAAVGAYPDALSYEEVSAATGIDTAGGTWRTYLGELRGLELIVGRGEIRASEDLFG